MKPSNSQLLRTLSKADLDEAKLVPKIYNKSHSSASFESNQQRPQLIDLKRNIDLKPGKQNTKQKRQT